MSDLRERILWSSANRLLKRYKPYVIAVGGGIAKTSTKVALGQVLKEAYPGQVLVGYGNLNTLIGVPLSIMSFKVDFHKSRLGYIGWAWILTASLWRSYTSKLPKYLILEYGTDRSGDISKLVDRLRPNMALLTIISPAHVENYKDMDDVADDEATLVRSVDSGGVVLINSSDQYISKRLGDVKAKIVKVVTDPELIFRNFALAAASELGIDKEVAETALAKPVNASGRFEIKKLKKFYLINDSYNANPDSMGAAFRVLKKAPGRKVAILGTMLELGNQSDDFHRQVGEAAHRVADVVIGVGDKANLYKPAKHFSGSEEAARGIFTSSEGGFPLLREGDSILVKGSRGVKMEKIAEIIIQNGL